MRITTDDVVRMTLDGTDDKAFRREKRDRRKKLPEPPTPVGECCACCRHWSPPRQKASNSEAKKDVYGTCGALLVVTKREPNGPEKGQVVTPQQAARFWAGEADSLRTTAGYQACMAYELGIDRREVA